MEKQTLSVNEEKERVYNILAEWRKRKAEDEKEAQENLKKPEYQAMLKELRKNNAGKGINISG